MSASGAISRPYFAQFPSGLTVSGRVTSGGVAVPGITMNLTGARTKSTTTDFNGNYRFSGLPDGAYTITPSHIAYTFAPPSINVTISGADLSGKNFTATQIGYTVSGTVTSGGAAFSGVTVNLTGAATKSTTTDSKGNYSFLGLSNGSYTATPSKAGYTFTPDLYGFSVSGANVTGKNFTAALTTYSISGTVTSGGAGFRESPSISPERQRKSTTTDSNGNYSFSGVSNGAYTVTPSKTGYTFTPQSLSVNVNGANVTGQNFTATSVVITYTISGTVTSGGSALQGVAVNLTGAATQEHDHGQQRELQLLRGFPMVVYTSLRANRIYLYSSEHQHQCQRGGCHRAELYCDVDYLHDFRDGDEWWGWPLRELPSISRERQRRARPRTATAITAFRGCPMALTQSLPAKPDILLRLRASASMSTERMSQGRTLLPR